MKFEFIQTKTFLTDAQRTRLTAEDIRHIENAIAANPGGAPLISGTGGLRKMRYAAEARGGGKRGGARVCYFLIAAASHVYLVMAFAKNEKQNLSQRDVQTVRKLIAAIRESYL